MAACLLSGSLIIFVKLQDVTTHSITYSFCYGSILHSYEVSIYALSISCSKKLL